MTGVVQIVVPQESQNLVVYGGAEWGTRNSYVAGSAYGTANSGTVLSGSVIVSSDYAFRGNYSFYSALMGTAAGTVYMGPTFNLGSAVTNTDYYVSFYGRPYPTQGTPTSVYVTLNGTTEWTSSTAVVHPELIESEGTAWNRYGVSIAPKAGGTVLSIVSPGSTSQWWYLDCVQVELGTVATTIMDHNSPGVVFDGEWHCSVVRRPASARSGGVVRDLEDYYGVNVMKIAGHQSPPQQQAAISRSALDGATWLQTRTTERAITFGCSIGGDSLENYHAKRDDFWYDIQRDRVAPPQPFILRYRGAGRTVQLPVVYDTGMEGGEMLGPYSEAFPLRVIAYDDPYWSEIKQGQALFNNITVLPVEQMVAYRSSQAWGTTRGYWDALGAPELTVGVGTQVIYCFAKDKSGSLYVGGDFTDLGGIAAADYIAKRSTDGTWSALATGTGGEVYAITPDANGNLYIGGAFVNLVDANGDGITKWNGNAFSSLGTGAQAGGGGNIVFALVIGFDGTLYAGGNFISMGGVANTWGIAKWNGSAWSAMGTGAADGYVSTLCVDKQGNIYAGGVFTQMGGVANTANIAKWNGTAWSSVGVFNTGVGGLALAPDGRIIAVGNFTTISGASITRAAIYNGASWLPMGSGLNDWGRAVAVTNNGNVYVLGQFTTAGGISTISNGAVWNGSWWRPLSFRLPGSPVFFQGLMADNNDIYFGFDTEGDATIYGIDSATGTVTNTGTAKAWPIITVTRSGGDSVSLQGLYNEDSGKEIHMAHALLDGQTVVLDLRPGQKRFYSIFPYANLLSEVNPASDLATFALIPGDNRIGVMCPSVGSPTVTVKMHWDIKHWSADGGAH